MEVEKEKAGKKAKAEKTIVRKVFMFDISVQLENHSVKGDYL